MILVDTSVWVDHLRHGDEALAGLLEEAVVLGHPWVTGELGLGSLAARDRVLHLLRALPQATRATDEEIDTLVASHGLAGSGIGWVDAGLLAATRLTSGARLWTRDRRLAEVADRLGIAPAGH